MQYGYTHKMNGWPGRIVIVFAMYLLAGCATVPVASWATGDTNARERLLFLSETTDGSPGLYAVAPDGTDLSEIPTSALIPLPPAVSPDGQQLAYVSACYSSESVMTMNSDGSQPLEIFNQPNVTAMRDLAWAPASDTTGEERLAFFAEREGNIGLQLIGIYPSTLYPTSEGTATPTWSSDGERVAFVAANEAQTSGDLNVMEVTSREATRLTDGTLQVASPQWSPDGERIVFVGQEQNSSNADLYSIHPDGSNLTKLTDTSEPEMYATWSPDGTQIAFSRSMPDGAIDMYVMNADGSTPTQLTSDLGAAHHPAWSRDGQTIAFMAGQTDQELFAYTVPAAGGEPVQVTDQSVTVPWIAWAKDPVPESSTISGIIAEFDTIEEVIILEEPVDGYDRIVFDEEPAGIVKTQFVGAEGFGLPISPPAPVLDAGQPIEVRGRAGDDGVFIAEVVWRTDVGWACE